MARVIMYLTTEESNALSELAIRERRSLRDQAALMIRHELENAGLLLPETPQPSLVADPSMVERESIQSTSNNLSEAV